MKLAFISALLGAALAMPAIAQDADIANGEKEFRKCRACHMIQDAGGTDIVKGGRTGPNLWGVIGRPAAAQEGFKYSEALIRLGEAGEVWDHDAMVAYITDPNKFVEETTGDASLKTKMTFKLNKDQEDIAAFLASVSPEAATN